MNTRPDDPGPGGDGPAETPEVPLEDLVAAYVDRLTDGERLARDQILAEQPDRGLEILEHLEAYLDLGLSSEVDVSASIGTLGDYTLRRRIGRGGMGVVYEAWENSLDRRVALKVLPPGISADARSSTRFLREAQIAAKLSHPQIVSVHATGIKEGTPWYAMEYVDGETLAQVLARIREYEPGSETPFGARDEVPYHANLAKAFAEVADGLQHAHSKGVIHRDIKPSNLILDAGDGRGGEAKGGRLRILDFGLARLEGQESLTASGDFVGTPLYMSPEQARRRKIEVDHRTDVYSLGATMYEALTSSPPFRGKDNQDTLSQIIERDPTEPRKRNPRVPKDLETIVLKCLRKDPGDRYGTAEALGQDLRRFVRGDPIEARPLSGAERWARRWARHRRGVLRWAVVALLAVTCAALGLKLWLDAREKRQEEYERAVVTEKLRLLRGRMLEAGGEKADRSAVENLQSFRLPADLEVAAAARRSVETAVRELSFLARAIPRRFEAHYYLAVGFRLLGKLDEARASSRRALELAPWFLPARILEDEISGRLDLPSTRKWLESHQAARWQALWLESYLAEKTKDWQAAERANEGLLRLDDESGGLYAGSSIDLFLGRALARIGKRDLVGALVDLERLHDRWPDLLEPALLRGKTWFLLDEKERAQAAFEDAYERAGNDARSEVATWIAAIYLSLEDHARSLEWAALVEEDSIRKRLEAVSFFVRHEFEEAARAAREACALDPDDPLALQTLAAATFWSQFGYLRQETIDEVVQLCEKALRLDPGLAHAQALLALIYQDRGEAEKALEACDRVIALGSTEPGVLSTFGLVCHREGWFEKLREILDKLEPRLPEIQRYERNLHTFYRGILLMVEGHREEGLERWKEAAVAGFYWASQFLGHALLRQGEYEGAVSYLEERIAAQEFLSELPSFWLAAAHDALGRTDEAVRVLCDVLAAHPRNASAHGLLLWFLRHRGTDRCVSHLEGLVPFLEKAMESPDVPAVVPRTLAFLKLRLSGSRDLREVRALLSRAIEGQGATEGETLAILAELEHAAGNSREAVLALERMLRLRLPGTFNAHVEPLTLYRNEVFPDLVSFPSVDAALASRPPAGDADLLAMFEAAASGSRRERCRTYLEGRILQRAGRPQEAAAKFAAIVESTEPGTGQESKPWLRLAESLETGDDAPAAEGALRRALRGDGARSIDIWNRWLLLSLERLGKRPDELLASFPSETRAPPQDEPGPTGDAHAGDIRWLLEEFEAGRPLRIDCGGRAEHEGPTGVTWSRDRFFRGGLLRLYPKRVILAAPDRALYEAYHEFYPDELERGYHVPLPAGRCRVTVHFWKETHAPCNRSVEVRMENERICDLASYENPNLWCTPATAASQTRTLEVEDGSLDITFGTEGYPRICGIEIEPLEGTER